MTTDGPLTVGELRRRLDGLDDDRWLYVYASHDMLKVQAETTGQAPKDDHDTIVQLIRTPLEFGASGAVQR
jgi:hypothetical protein